jgi:hypothetical protein
MPFTVTHVAAAVPVAWLCRWRVPFSALAIGSMVPDISGFYPQLLDYHATHTVRGVLTHCLPIGLICYYAYHAILKRPLVDWLPSAASDRLRPWTENPINFAPLAIVAVTACIALGATTHVVWDAFTHGGRWGVDMFPALRNVVVDSEHRPVRWYALIQHGSSILFLPPMLLGFVWWIRKQPRPAEPIDRAQMPRAVSWSLIALLVFGTALYMQMLRENYPNLHWIDAISRSVKHGGAVALAATLLYCVGMHIFWWREKNYEPYLTDSTVQSIARCS